MLPAVTSNYSYVEYFDAQIGWIDVCQQQVTLLGKELEIFKLIVSFWRVICDDEIREVDGRVLRDDETYHGVNGHVVRSNDDEDYRVFEIEANPVWNSLYAQLLSAVSCHTVRGDLSIEECGEFTLKESFVRLVIGNGRFLIGILPYMDITSKMREYYGLDD